MTRAATVAKRRGDLTAREFLPGRERLSENLHDALGNFSDVDPATLAPRGRRAGDPLDVVLREWEVLTGDLSHRTR